MRAVVSARIWSRNTARMREIMTAAREAAAQRPYWRGARSRIRMDDVDLTGEQLSEITALSLEGRKQSELILGSEGEIPGYSQLRHPFLSSSKAMRLVLLEQDYGLLRYQAYQEMTAGFQMPGDGAALKLLDEEYKRDIDALLTPEEKMANDLRNSTTALQLQRAFAGFSATEEDYNAVFALQNRLEEKYSREAALTASSGGPDAMSEFYRARAEEQKNIDAQIKETLGDARYAEYVRGSRKDYQTLLAAAQRFNLAADTVAQTYQVREDAASEAKRISDDGNLNAGQKAEAYAALAKQASGQIRTALGDEVGDAYIDNALPWLKNLPKGGTVRIDNNGNVFVSQPRPPASPPRGR